MDEIEKLFQDLSLIAPAMESLTKSDHSTPFLERLSGSIVWRDELPKSAPVSMDCLRFVFKYRTGLLIGKPQPKLEAFWQQARKRFPLWIGFSPERVARSEELAEFYRRERRRPCGER